MQVLLQITAGPATGRRFRLRQGQIARVGRTEWSDFSVPDDGAMSDVHFEIRCDAYTCWVRQLPPGETQRNGEPISESRIRNGDTITAGETTFAVQLEGVSGLDPHDMGDDEGSPEDDQPGAAAICTGIALSDAGRAKLTGDIKAGAFLDALLADVQLDDAAKFLAAWLTRPQAVAWGCTCVASAAGERLSAAQQVALKAAAAWASEPSEELRRAAQQAAEALGGRSPAGWLALAAFWSDGSIGPPDAPEIPAPQGMTARAVGNAVMTAAGMGGPQRPKATMLQEFFSQGRALLEPPA